MLINWTIQVYVSMARLSLSEVVVQERSEEWQEKGGQRRDREQMVRHVLHEAVAGIAKHHTYDIRWKDAARPTYGSVAHYLLTGNCMFRKPIRITESVYQIRAIGARVTVLAQGAELMLVDAGLLGSSHAIAQGLAELGRSPSQIQQVVITHAHPDHSGGLAELVSGTDAAVAAHSLEADIIEGMAPAPNPLRWKVVGAVSWSVLSKLMGNSVPVVHRVEDGEPLTCQTDVRVVHLPGHTPGSIGLHLPRERVVIVGDALQYKLGRKLYPPAPGVTQHADEALRSLEKLLDLDFDTICFSHFPAMRNQPRKALEELLKRHMN